MYFETITQLQTIQMFCEANNISYNKAPSEEDKATQNYLEVSLYEWDTALGKINAQSELNPNVLHSKLTSVLSNLGIDYLIDNEQLMLKSITAICEAKKDTIQVAFDATVLIPNLEEYRTSYAMHPLLLHYINDFPQFNGYMLSLMQPPFTEPPLTNLEILRFYHLEPFVTTKISGYLNNRTEATFDLFEFLEVLSKRFFLRFQTESLLADLIVHNMPKTIENFVAIYNSCATILGVPLLDSNKIYAIDCSSDDKKQKFYNKLCKFPESKFKIVLYQDDIAYLQYESKIATIIDMG